MPGSLGRAPGQPSITCLTHPVSRLPPPQCTWLAHTGCHSASGNLQEIGEKGSSCQRNRRRATGAAKPGWKELGSRVVWVWNFLPTPNTVAGQQWSTTLALLPVHMRCGGLSKVLVKHHPHPREKKTLEQNSTANPGQSGYPRTPTAAADKACIHSSPCFAPAHTSPHTTIPIPIPASES